MQTRVPFLERLDLRVPIIQAPMAGVSTPRLAAAVSNSGALGSLGIGASTVDQGRDALRQTRSLTDRPFNVNVFCHTPAVRDPAAEAAWVAHLAPLFAEAGLTPPTELAEIYTSATNDDALFAMLIEERPPVVSFHFGVPGKERIQALHDAGIYTLASATNLAEAQRIEQVGIDAVVAQGIEAGGHRGMFDPGMTDEYLSTAVLVRLLATHTALPVIAAGGIMDGQSIRAMLTLGASAAQLGTAFILCPESAANAEYRANLQSERAAITRLTSVLSGRPARGIVNRLIQHGEVEGHPPVASYPVAYDAAKQLHGAAAKKGNHAFAAHWAGQGAPLARAMPACQLIATLIDEMQ